MADDAIGTVRVDVVADYSKLSQGLQSAQSEASKAGASIASSLTAAVAPSGALTAATERLKTAQAALASESAKQLAQITPTAVAYGTAQISLQHLNNELAAAQSNFSAASAAAASGAAATGAAATASNMAAAAQQNLAQATQTATAAIGQQTVAATANIGAIMAGANAAVQAAGGYSQVVPAANGAGASMLRFGIAIMAARKAIGELEDIRKSEMDILHLSEATGISAQAFAQFQGAINRAGGDGDQFGRVIVFLSRSIEQGQRGVKTMSDELSRLGVTSRDPIQAFFQIADTLHNTADKSEALAAASRVLGRGQQELIGIMGQGSAALRDYYAQSESLAKTQVSAIDSAVRLTTAQAEVKQAFTEVATGALPVLTVGLQIIATAFSAVNVVVKLVAQTILHTFSGAIQATKDFGAVLSDLAHGKWDMLAIDAGEALGNVRAQFKSMTKDMERETGESVSFISKLWAGASPKVEPGAGRAFPAPRPTGAGVKPEHVLKQKFEDELAELKSDHEVTTREEQRFWQDRYAIALSKGAAFAELQVEIHRRIGTLNQQAIRQWHQAEITEVTKDAKDLNDQLNDVMNEAQESTGMPKTAGLDFLRAKLEAETLSEGAYEEALKRIPKLESEAAAESNDVMHRWVKASEDIFAEGGARTAAEASEHAAQMIAVLQQLGGMEDEIAAQQKRKNAADKTVESQTLKVGDIGAAGAAASSATYIQSQKISLQREYESAVLHTYQQEIAYKQQLATLDEQIMGLKRAAALEEFNLATQAGDVVKAEQAAAQWLREDDAIRLHRQSTEAEVAKLTRQSSLGGQIDAGLAKTAEGTVSKLSSGIAGLVTQTKGWGQAFHGILKDIEKQLVETFAGSILKQGLNALVGSASKPAQSAPLSAATSAGTVLLTSALTANTGATVAHTGIMATHLGVMITHMGSMIANTAATIGNTIATIYNSVKLAILATIEAIKSFFGFVGGGDPDPNTPFIAGEKGAELIYPKGRAFTVVPADKTKALFAGVANLRVPGVPVAATSSFSSSFESGGGASASGSSGSVTNQNTGRVGDTHYNIYGASNPRETMRQISDFEKRQTGKYSPANS